MDYVLRFEWKDTGTDEWTQYEQRGDKAFFERIRDTKAPEIYALCIDCLQGRQPIDIRHMGLYFEPAKQHRKPNGNPPRRANRPRKEHPGPRIR